MTIIAIKILSISLYEASDPRVDNTAIPVFQRQKVLLVFFILIFGTGIRFIHKFIIPCSIRSTENRKISLR